jgi:hypothetical protein
MGCRTLIKSPMISSIFLLVMTYIERTVVISIEVSSRSAV